MSDTDLRTVPALTPPAARIADLLHEAGEIHEKTYRITNAVHDDWASWYANWLIELSELPEVLGQKPVPSELVYLLVLMDKDLRAAEPPAEFWEQNYARRIVEHFTA